MGGAKWKKMTDAQKKPFNAKYAKAKAVYDKKFAKYKTSAQYKKFQEANNVGGLIKKVCKKFGIANKKRNPTTFPSDPNAPKKATSAYFFFAASVRPGIQKKLAGKPVSEVAKVIAEQWKKIGSAEKAKFEKKSASDKKAS
eukprot:TRINITY_DN66_c0_g1_i12.p1 TRINITY_DN66_c0_g1~~TRINITY_DN66_c0_g1_i12.p1  ORF type:complete len:141 (+),score=51.20 TRINITY_DN66_c0_g1_i12:56-478(+)